MIKATSSGKIMSQVIIGLFVSLGIMLAIFHFFGELQGLICVVIALLVQISLLTGRVVALERRLQDSQDSLSSKPANLADKAV